MNSDAKNEITRKALWNRKKECRRQIREEGKRERTRFEGRIGARGSSWRLRLGLSRTARRGCARVIGVGGGAGRVGGQGKAWNWWRQSVARRAPQRPSDLAVQFFHLLPYRAPLPFSSLLFSSSLLLFSSPFFASFSFFFLSLSLSILTPHASRETHASSLRTLQDCDL